MGDVERIFSESVICADSPDSVDRGAVLEVVENRGFCCIRGVVSRESVRRAKSGLRARFDPSQDRPSVGETPDEIMDHFQKIVLVGVGPSDGDQRTVKPVQYVPRLYRSIYLPLNMEDRYGLHPVLRGAARLRNLVYGFGDPDFCIEAPQEGLWTAARVHHFPSGGGFACPHRDLTLPGVLSEMTGFGFYQLIVVMSLLGEDFERGGAFVESDGSRIYYERYAELGDVIVFDTRSIHGVEDIDPHRLLRTDTLEGRLSGLVSLYADLRKPQASRVNATEEHVSV